MPRTIRFGYTLGKPAGLVLAFVAGHLGGVEVERATGGVLPGMDPPAAYPLPERVARDAEALGRLGGREEPRCRGRRVLRGCW